MIRGSIERLSDGVVSGWVFSSELPLGDRLLLAFLDGNCVGSGRIGLHRPDLEAAGLGDGNCGFHFPVAVSTETAGKMVLKFEDSDFVLIQKSSQVSGAISTVAVDSTSPTSNIEKLRWKLSRGWITQSDYDFLRSLHIFGFYDRPLAASEQGSYMEIATGALSIVYERGVPYAQVDIKDGAEFQSHVAALSEEGMFSIGLWSKKPFQADIVEGSHLRINSGDNSSRLVSTSVVVGPDRLVFVDTRCDVTLDALGAGNMVSIISAAA